MNLISIDPGIATGWSSYSNGHMYAAGTGFPSLNATLYGQAIMERPQIYPYSKGRPNDLITLAIQVGEYKNKLESFGYFVELVLPHTWKGNTPKDIHHTRILARLSETEKACIPRCKVSKKNPHGYDNNCLDAVGLGLYKVGRLVPGR